MSIWSSRRTAASSHAKPGSAVILSITVDDTNHFKDITAKLADAFIVKTKMSFDDYIRRIDLFKDIDSAKEDRDPIGESCHVFLPFLIGVLSFDVD